jgi:hypothetical protein
MVKLLAGLVAAIGLTGFLASPAVARWQVVDTIGSSGTGNGEFHRPHGIALDSAGNLYVTDMDNNRVQKLRPNGNFLSKFGSFGAGAGQFDHPRGIAIDEQDRVYVADTGNNRIQRFSPSGAFQLQWGSPGSGAGQFSTPTGIALDDAGHVYVTDTGNHRVQKFGTAGEFLAEWGSFGSGPGQFITLSDLEVRPGGHVYVADQGMVPTGSLAAQHPRIQEFQRDGTWVDEVRIETIGTIRGIGLGSEFVFASVTSPEFDVASVWRLRYSLSTVSANTFGEGELQSPAGIAVSSSDHVYVVDEGADGIQGFADVDTPTTTTAPTTTAPTTTAPTTTAPTTTVPPPTTTTPTTLAKSSQTIAFTSTPPAGAIVGGGYTATANASSGLPVTFSVGGGTTPAACTVSPGGSVAFTGVGTCVVAADQAGNAGFHPAPTATQPVTIAAPDTTPPTVHVPGPVTVDAPADASGAVVTYTVSASDSGANPDPAVTCAPPSGSTFPIGTTTVNCSATDAAGNPGSNSFTVTVRDVTPPVVQVPAPITVDATGSSGGAVVDYVVTATDNELGKEKPALTCSPPSGSTFAIGTTTVGCTATDTTGNTGTGSFTVTVRDILPPVLSLPAPITVDATGDTGGAAVAYSAGATDDDRRSPTPAVTCSVPSGSTFAIGTTMVLCQATDLSGNTGTGSFAVEVIDVLPPVLTLPAPIRVDATGDTGGAMVTFTATSVDDNRAFRNPPVTCTPGSGSTFAIGTATVACSATDASGNVATGSFTVDVIDVLPPVLHLPADIRVDAVGTTGGAPVTYTATATDDDRRFPTPPITCTPASGTDFAIGPNSVDCTSTDHSGNVALGSFGVEVVDILPPALTLPANITVNATVPEGAVVPFVATAVDDDRRIPTPPVTCTPAPGSMIAIGDTTVTCTATDLYGNVATGSFTIHVKGAAEQLTDLVAASQGVGPGNAVAAQVEKAPADLAAGNVDKACKSLDKYIKQVNLHTPKKIDPSVADARIADATRIKNVMACG